MMTYRISVDDTLCSGFGACVDASPDIFVLERGGLARARVWETDDPSALDAAASCPMGAIVVEEVRAA